MVDFAAARRGMIDSQVSSSAVTERRLLNAMGRIPREAFVPAERRHLAYIDDLHRLPNNRFIPAPALFARLVQLANVTEGDRVLELGSATGYGTAVLAALGREVVGLEADADLARDAAANLQSNGVDNARVIHGEVSDISDERFDAIVVEGALDSEPTDLLQLLNRGGRLVAIIQRGRMGVAHRFVATAGGFKKDSHFDAIFPLLHQAARPVEFVF